MFVNEKNAYSLSHHTRPVQSSFFHPCSARPCYNFRHSVLFQKAGIRTCGGSCSRWNNRLVAGVRRGKPLRRQLAYASGPFIKSATHSWWLIISSSFPGATTLSVLVFRNCGVGYLRAAGINAQLFHGGFYAAVVMRLVIAVEVQAPAETCFRQCSNSVSA